MWNRKRSVNNDCNYRFLSNSPEIQVPFILFSDNKRSRAGERLAKKIISQKLGGLIKSRVRKNPNSGNKVQIWIWTPNIPRLKRWWKKVDEEAYKEYLYKAKDPWN